MDNPMPRSDQPTLREGAFEPAKKDSEGVFVGCTLSDLLVGKNSIFAILRREMHLVRMPSNSPWQIRSWRIGSLFPGKRENLMLEEPAFRTRMAPLMICTPSYDARAARATTSTPDGDLDDFIHGT